MKSTYFSLIIIGFIVSFSSCKKEAGEGGSSFIQGKVYAKYYDKYFYTINHTSYAPDVDVYIIYGEDFTFAERQRTNFDGSYEFKYLRPGAYKIYAYSRDSSGLYKNKVNPDAPDIAIIQNVDITKRMQTILAPDINILK